MPTPSTQDLQLSPGWYEVYQDIGTISSDRTRVDYLQPWVVPADVTVTDAAGKRLGITASSLPMGFFPAPYVPGPRQQQGILFSATAEFRVRKGGDVHVVVAPQNPARIAVASPPGVTTPLMRWWRAVMIMGVVAVLTAVVLSVQLAVKSRRERARQRETHGRAGERLPVPVATPTYGNWEGAPIPGWYADPWAPGFQRLWDGTVWTDQIR